MDKKGTWKKLTSKVTYQTPYFKVYEDKVLQPSGKDGTYWVLEFAPAVMVVPVTDKNEVFLIGQFRYPTQMFSWEVPGGSTDREDFMLAAKRELQEETGLISEEWEDLGVNQILNGTTNKICHILLAKNVQQTNNNKQEEEGIIKMEKIPFAKVFEKIEKGEITDSESISALTMAALKLKILKV